MDELKEQLEKKIEQGMEFEGPEPPPDAGEGDEDMQVIVLPFFLSFDPFTFFVHLVLHPTITWLATQMN